MSKHHERNTNTKEKHLATMTSPILSHKKISDFPVDLPPALQNVLGTITEASVSDPNEKGNRRIKLTVVYASPFTGKESTAYLAWNGRDEYLQDTFNDSASNLERNPLIQYNINFKKLMFSFLTATDLQDTPLYAFYSPELIASTVGKQVLFSLTYKLDATSTRGFSGNVSGFKKA